MHMTYVGVAMQFYRRSDDVGDDMNEMDIEMKSVSARCDKHLLDNDTKDDNENQASAGTPAESSYSWRQLLTDSEQRLPLLIACMLVVIQQFSGINAVRIQSLCACHKQRLL